MLLTEILSLLARELELLLKKQGEFELAARRPLPMWRRLLLVVPYPAKA